MSMLVQLMSGFRQATSYYLNQCWPRSLTPHGVTRPQWVNPQTIERNFQDMYSLRGFVCWTNRSLTKLVDILQTTFWITFPKRKTYIDLKPLRVKFCRGNINMYLEFMSFLNTDRTQAAEIRSQIRQGHTYITVNIMDADDLATQGARASAAMILT